MEVLPLPVAVDFTEDVWSLSLEDPEEQVAREVLAELIAGELRQARARYRHLQQQRAPSEILLPAGILQTIAADVLSASSDEPCGIRGCVIYIDFEDSQRKSTDRKQRIGMVKCHPYTVNTFELYLTLRPHSSSWTSKLPLFLQNLAYRSTMVISSEYTLTKRKLFRSSH
jgi:hypothetical protein